MKLNKERILKDGILEAYFLGDLSRKQEQEVFEILKSDPDLMKQYRALEQSMEKLALENAVSPPKSVKDNLLKQIGKKEGSRAKEMKSVAGMSSHRHFNMAAAVALVFMTSSLILWINLKETKEDLDLTRKGEVALKDSIELMSKKSKQQAQLMTFINDPGTNKFLLKGNKLAPEAMIVSYVNHKKESVLINIQNLPKLDGKDYQMWADVDGEMIDMGVIDASKKTLTMAYIKNAESINITIENEGGSDHPDVSKLIGSFTI